MPEECRAPGDDYGLVEKNVVELAETPKGRPGRPSKSLTLAPAKAILTATAGDRMHPYIVVSLLTGVRTEEVRALRWDHLDLDGDPDADPPMPSHMFVWRSDREGGGRQDQKVTAYARTPPAGRDGAPRLQDPARPLAQAGGLQVGGERSRVHEDARYRVGRS